MSLKNIVIAVLVSILLMSSATAQNVRVNSSKRATAIPKACESVVPASIDGVIDVGALIREANCKGSGDMMSDYTYIMKVSQRRKDKKGKSKEETTIFEVYFPTLKSGTSARGVLLATSHNGNPMPLDQLNRARVLAGERLERQENEIAKQRVAQPSTTAIVSGMSPLGYYASMTSNSGTFGIKHDGVSLSVHTILTSCDLVFLRLEKNEGRENLVLSFAPKAGAQFSEYEKYLAHLKGEIWIDSQDRIVTKVIGWRGTPEAGSKTDAASQTSGQAPVVQVEMVRLPEGVWLPRLTRIDATDYVDLFDHSFPDCVITFSEYKRVNTDVKEGASAVPGKPF